MSWKSRLVLLEDRCLNTYAVQLRHCYELINHDAGSVIPIGVSVLLHLDAIQSFIWRHLTRRSLRQRYGRLRVWHWSRLLLPISATGSCRESQTPMLLGAIQRRPRGSFAACWIIFRTSCRAEQRGASATACMPFWMADQLSSAQGRIQQHTHAAGFLKALCWPFCLPACRSEQSSLETQSSAFSAPS